MITLVKLWHQSISGLRWFFIFLKIVIFFHQKRFQHKSSGVLQSNCQLVGSHNEAALSEKQLNYVLLNYMKINMIKILTQSREYHIRKQHFKECSKLQKYLSFDMRSKSYSKSLKIQSFIFKSSKMCHILSDTHQQVCLKGYETLCTGLTDE